MAERGFDATMQTGLSSTSAAIALLVYMNWPGGAVRFWTGHGTLPYGGNSYLGAAKWGSIDKVADSIDQTDIGIQLTLNYLDDSLRNELNTNNPVGQDAWLALALLNPTTLAVTSFYQIFTGYVDRIEIEDAGVKGAIKVRLASELAKLQRSNYYLLTDAHQQLLFTGDKGLEFSSQMDQTIVWGRKPIILIPGNPGNYSDWTPP